MRMTPATEDALASCLDAVAEPAGWGAALQHLAESLGAESCTFCSQDLQQLSSRVMPVSTGHQEFADAWIRNEPYAPDPHFRSGCSARNRASAVVLEHQFSTEEERRRLPYYQETARPARREWHAISKFMVGDSRWWLSLYRSDRRGPFTPQDVPRLAAVAPRLVPIISMATKFAAFRWNASLLSLEQARCAAFIVDVRGHVVSMNRHAESLMGADFRLVGRQLATGDAPSNLSLQQLVARSITTREGETFADGPVAISCEGETRYVIEAIPMTSVLSAYFSSARALLLVTSLRARTTPAAPVLHKAFGLTTAEARLAQVLASGSDLQEAVARLGIAMPTARSQLQAIFGKTGTRRQAELMSLLARLQ